MWEGPATFGRNRESRTREAAGRRNWPEAVPRKMSGGKRLAYGTSKIGVIPADTLGQVKRKRKSQLCDDHRRFENGARFQGLLPFAAVTSEWPTRTKPLGRRTLRVLDCASHAST